MRTLWPIGYIKRKVHERATKHKEETPTDRAARVSAVATAWMALFTLVLMLVGVGTYFILKNQLHEMHEGGTQTDRIIAAANLIESHQKQMVADNKDILLDNRNALDKALSENRSELAKALAQNRKALEASEAQSKKALDAGVSASLAANRAWLAPSHATLITPLENGVPVKIAIHVVNVGREPALGIVEHIEPEYVDYIHPTDLPHRDPNTECAGLRPETVNGLVMYPNLATAYNFAYDISDTPENRRMIAAVLKRQRTLVIQGCFSSCGT